MLGATDGDGAVVTCPACGRTLRQADTREYDKFGDRWSRRDKAFEYFCKPCHRALCHQDRDNLEELLVDAEAGARDRASFLRRFTELAMEQDESLRDRDRES